MEGGDIGPKVFIINMLIYFWPKNFGYFTKSWIFVSNFSTNNFSLMKGNLVYQISNYRPLSYPLRSLPTNPLNL